MKVILQQTVKNLGAKGDVVEVSDGYGRNYLIPRGLAVAADESNVKQLQHEKSVEKRREERERQQAAQLKEELEKLRLKLQVKAGESGRLFGSVTPADIAAGLQSQAGIEIDRRKIELSDPIKSVGEHSVTVRVYPGIVARLKVVIEAV